MELTLPFKNMENIQDKYTCKGQSVSPEIKIANIPKAAKSLAIIVDDPDAPYGTFVHWVAWNLAAANIPEGAKSGVQGVNTAGKLGYTPPCPPPGKPHRYIFNVYALGTQLDLAAGAAKEELLQAMEGHILAKAESTGLFKR